MSAGAVVWLTGLPRSGKSTLAARVRERLAAAGRAVLVLDGDEVRAALVPRPGYDATAREQFYETLARLASLLARQGATVLVPATAHKRAFRERARRLAPRFVEVHVATSVDESRQHDPAGLYASDAQAALPGAGVAYEPPEAPEVVAAGGRDDEAAARVARLVAECCDAR